MIAFSCPGCQKQMTVKDDLAGKKGKCLSCGQPVLVPAPAAKTLAPRAGRADEATMPPERRMGLPTFQGKPPLSEATTDHLGFLAPAQGPGELGWLGPYRVLKVLGAGGMGVVFQAEDAALKRPVALKAMLPNLAVSVSARQRFMREAQAAAAVSHDHIVQIFQVGEDRGVPFIAMQFLEGEPLDERLRREALPTSEVLRIGRETARGLAAAHEKGLIHRDIKPANVWLEGEEGRVKILDFGLARAAADDQQLTQQGAIIGTPAFMAPEQAAGAKLDGRCDLFSLGVMLYRMATGKLPFNGTDTISTLMAVSTETPRTPRKANPDVPEGLSDLIMDLLGKKPDDRPQTAREVVERLAALEAGESTEVLERQRETRKAAATSATEDTDLLSRKPAREKRTSRKRQKDSGKGGLPVPVLAGAGIGVALLAGFLVYVAMPGWKKGAPSTEPVAGLKLPGGAAKDGKPTEKGDDGIGKTDGKPPRPPAPVDGTDSQGLFAVAEDAVKAGKLARTKQVGAFEGDKVFEEVPAEGAVLTGFMVGIGKFGSSDVVHYLRPIYQSRKGRFLGAEIGAKLPREVTLEAKRGYAVGKVHMRAGLGLDGIALEYMAIRGAGLDPDQTYKSDHAGGAGGNPQVLGDGAPIVGVHGKILTRASAANGLGLVTVPR